MKRLMLVFSIAVLLLLAPRGASAQTNSNQANVGLQADVMEGISVSVGVGNVSFTIVAAGPADGNVPIPIETSWNLPPGLATLKLYAYFDSATEALSKLGINFIPSSEVYGSVNAGPFNAFTQAGPFVAGASSLLLFSVGLPPDMGNRNDMLSLRIDPVAAHPAGNYGGILHIKAQAL